MFVSGPELWAIAFGALLIGGLVKGTLGIGLPIASLAVLASLMPAQTALAVVALPLFVTNLMQATRSHPVLTTLREVWPVALPMVVVLWFATGLVPGLDPQLLFICIGAGIVLFAAVNLFLTLPPLPASWVAPLAPVAGAVAGLMGGVSGIWGPPIAMYLISRRLPRETFIRMAGTIWCAGSFPLVLGYIHHGVLDARTAPLSALACLPAVLGYLAGERLRQRIDSERFRTLLLAVFLLMGLNLIRRGLF
ncbi:MAG: sulfite exporter TauE/SafE family protein [Candidatus Competibacterales bacterium]|nr:sulfite exporter TauE/SafE family protein [Candidatus Competibacterales bacterium]